MAGDIGPTGALLEPLGTLTFDEAFDIFAEQVRAAETAGCDLIVVETMADLLEAKAAVLAAVESTTLPVFATMTFGEDGRTFLGTTPAIAATTLSALGASAVGLNCSLGPVELAPLVEELAPHNRALVMAQPNAGLPRIQDGETVFDVGPDEFARAMEAILDAGATVVGGCCGTTPAHIAALSALLDARPLPAVEPSASRVILSERSEPKDLPAPSIPNPLYRPAFAVTSAQQMVSLPAGEPRIAVIGERINPTGKKKLKAALQAGDVDYLVAEAAAQQRAGADILDVNVGVPGLDEPTLLSQVTRTLQATVPLPLQLDSSDPVAIEVAARAYAGRPMVNSVNGKADNLAAVLPVVARYGCTVVGLTLDENGIPPTAEERLAIAERIVATAESYGIPREDVAIDCLVMAAATNQDEVREILRAVALVKERLGVRTVLGVSNVSFGLPARPLVNSTFLAAAFGAGLDMPILNPLNARYRDTVATFRILNGQDAGCRAFLEAYANTADPYEVAAGISTAGVVGGSIPVGGDLGRPSSSKATPLEEGGASPAPTEGRTTARRAREARCRACYRLRFEEAARYAREHGVPYLGICLGMQIAVIDFARSVLGLSQADSTEFNPDTPDPIIHLMDDQQGKIQTGGTMRLGAYDCRLTEGTKARALYGRQDVVERHRHRFELNNDYRGRLEAAGMAVAGVNPERDLVEVVELKNHPWFVACQYHPEFKSRPNRPHPLFAGLVGAAIEYKGK